VAWRPFLFPFLSSVTDAGRLDGRRFALVFLFSLCWQIFFSVNFSLRFLSVCWIVRESVADKVPACCLFEWGTWPHTKSEGGWFVDWSVSEPENSSLSRLSVAEEVPAYCFFE